MSRCKSGFVILLLLLLPACRNSSKVVQPTPHYYVTALEAYEQIRQTMLTWHEDAMVTYISSLGGYPSPEWRPDSSGKAPDWGFTVHSPSTLKITQIIWVNGEVMVGIDGIPGYEISTPSAEEGLPIDRMINSDEAVEIAVRSGATSDWTLLNISIDRFDNVSKKYLPPSWGLTYINSHDPSQERRVIIDAVTGEVVRNDFAK